MYLPMLLALLQAMPNAAEWKERHYPDVPAVPACTFQRPAKIVGSMAGLPKPVRDEVQRYFKGGGGIADVAGEFNSSDTAVKGVPRFRFIRAYQTEEVWFIWWEAGGFGRNVNTLAVTRQASSNASGKVYRVARGSVFADNLCAGSKAFLTGARAATGF